MDFPQVHKTSQRHLFSLRGFGSSFNTENLLLIENQGNVQQHRGSTWTAKNDQTWEEIIPEEYC